jgi:hypothetical protein
MIKSISNRSRASRHTKRFTALNTQYLRAYRKKIESDKTAEDIIQTAKFNLKVENAKLPQNQRRKQLSLLDLINTTDIQDS